MTHPFDCNDGKCPDCGRVFTLAELKQMAEGDGWRRYMIVRLQSGQRAVVSFSEFNPATMTPFVAEPRASIE